MDDGLRPFVLPLPAAFARRVDLRSLRIGTGDAAPWMALLDRVERERSSRFADARDRARFGLGRGLLRLMLGEALDRPAHALSFETGVHGKPSLADAGPFAFNVSHSGDYVMAAVARASAVGLDIERHRPDLDHARLVPLVFTAAETRAMGRYPGGAAFFRHWVLKEAVLKGLGVGLTLDPHALEIRTNPEPITAALAGADGLLCLSDWEIADLEAPPGYSAALAFCP